MNEKSAYHSMKPMLNLPNNKTKHLLDEAFYTIIYLKGIDAILGIIAAFLLLIPSTFALKSFVVSITQEELREDPKDFVANFLRSVAARLSPQDQFFAFLYLFIHGAIKLFVVIALLRNKRWAYPLALVVFGLFLLYEIYRLITAPSWLVGVFALFDVFVIVTTALEYQTKKRQAV